MNLPPDKARLLRQYDNEKKWELVCDQVSITRFWPVRLTSLPLEDKVPNVAVVVHARCTANRNRSAALRPRVLPQPRAVEGGMETGCSSHCDCAGASDLQSEILFPSEVFHHQK